MSHHSRPVWRMSFGNADIFTYPAGHDRTAKSHGLDVAHCLILRDTHSNLHTQMSYHRQAQIPRRCLLRSRRIISSFQQSHTSSSRSRHIQFSSTASKSTFRVLDLDCKEAIERQPSARINGHHANPSALPRCIPGLCYPHAQPNNTKHTGGCAPSHCTLSSEAIQQGGYWLPCQTKLGDTIWYRLILYIP